MRVQTAGDYRRAYEVTCNLAKELRNALLRPYFLTHILLSDLRANTNTITIVSKPPACALTRTQRSRSENSILTL